MADEQVNGAGDKAAAASPPSEAAKAAAVEAAKELHGRLPVKDATPADHAVPAHSPDVAGDGDASEEQARGRNPNQTPPTFSQRLESLRQILPDANTLERVREAIEPECP